MKSLFVSRAFIFIMMVFSMVASIEAAGNKTKEKSSIPVDSIPGKWIVVNIEDLRTGEVYDTSEEFTILPFSVNEESLKALRMSHAPQSADSVIIQSSDNGDIINDITYWVYNKAGKYYTDNISFTLGDFVRKPCIFISLTDLKLIPAGLICQDGKMIFSNSIGEKTEIQGIFTLKRKAEE